MVTELMFIPNDNIIKYHNIYHNIKNIQLQLCDMRARYRGGVPQVSGARR